MNPYNFVSINGNQIDRKDVRDIYEGDEELHTGYLECELVTRTPLAIPDISKNSDIKEYKFYSIDGKNPAIPGSSLRGMIRSVYETVTDSCFSTMKENTHLSLRVSSRNAYAPGLLIKDKKNSEWKLYKAKTCYIKIEGEDAPYRARIHNKERYIVDNGTKEKFYLGDEVEICDPREVKDEGYVLKMKHKLNTKRYVFVGEQLKSKKNERVFKNTGKEVRSKNSVKEAMQLLEETLNIYRNPSINKEYQKKHYGYKGYKEAKEKKGVIPVWYKVENERLKLSMASIGREFYNNTLNDVVEQKAPCKDRENLCAACALFGMARRKAVGSHIRITDAVADKSKIKNIRNVELKSLSTPRYSYLPFYAKNGERCPKSYDEDGVEIRGRKYYWHIPMAATNRKIYTYDKEKDGNISEKMKNGIFELVDKEAVFSFRIYYDNITEEQLEELKWVVCLGENASDGEMCHKLGYGKPLGLGSVKVYITSQWERTLSKTYSYTLKECNVNKFSSKIEKLKQVEELRKIVNFHCMDGETVEYPRIYNAGDYLNAKNKKNKVASHQWFKRYKEERGMLPDIRSFSDKKKMQLPYYKYIDNQKTKKLNEFL